MQIYLKAVQQHKEVTITPIWPELFACQHLYIQLKTQIYFSNSINIINDLDLLVK